MRWRTCLGVLLLLAACSGSTSPVPTPSPSATASGAATGKIALASIRDGPYEYIYVANADGSGLTQVTAGDSFGDILPTWSPDGRQIAFSRLLPNGGQDIYVVNADGTNTHALTTTTKTYEDTPAWSPDGATIAFNRFTFTDADIWVMNVDGSDAKRLTSGPAMDVGPSWSPDARRIVFQRYDLGKVADADLFVMDADGTHISRLTHDAHAGVPAWSPDGTKIAFWSNIEGDPIMILEVDTGDVSTLVNADDSIGSADEECGVVASWSPDGKTIAWAGCEHLPTDLYVVGADGANLSKLPDTSGSSDPAWQPV